MRNIRWNQTNKRTNKQTNKQNTNAKFSKMVWFFRPCPNVKGRETNIRWNDWRNKICFTSNNWNRWAIAIEINNTVRRHAEIWNLSSSVQFDLPHVPMPITIFPSWRFLSGFALKKMLVLFAQNELPANKLKQLTATEIPIIKHWIWLT